MNPNLAYHLYQAGRTKTRAEVLADDARRGLLASALARPARRLTGRARGATRTSKDLGVAAGQSVH